MKNDLKFPKTIVKILGI